MLPKGGSKTSRAPSGQQRKPSEATSCRDTANVHPLCSFICMLNHWLVNMDQISGIVAPPSCIGDVFCSSEHQEVKVEYLVPTHTSAHQSTDLRREWPLLQPTRSGRSGCFGFNLGRSIFTYSPGLKSKSKIIICQQLEELYGWWWHLHHSLSKSSTL